MGRVKVKLRDVPRNTKIYIEHLRIFDNDDNQIKELDFKHIDGMYSLCYYGERMLHLGASTTVYIECDHVKREGESCTLNDNCKYPNCK